MLFYIGVGATWVICVVGGIAYQRKNKSTKYSVKVLNISDRAVKHKKYQTALNERTKGFSRR